MPQQKKRNLKNVSPEVLFAQKLAANDPTLRNRAVKKLQKWLKVRSEKLSSEEILRIWKGLHYCFWMSDKPIVQEELAETIGQLTHCFTPGSKGALSFVEAGLITEGREWVGIDQWRMDKFMMLMRRFLRQVFSFLLKSEWGQLEEVSDIFSRNVVSNNQATLGFRLHFTDIFLEELAKVGGEELDSDIILGLIEPFAKELAHGDDERLAKHIVERIFQHLMRQSDVGIATEDAFENGDEDEEESVADEEMEQDSDEDEDMPDLNEAKDPRAGNVSVVLPQLKPDFVKLADKLFGYGGKKDLSSKRRTLLYDLTKEFKDLSEGLYPLIPDMSEEEAQIPKLKIGKVARKNAQEELEHQEKLKTERDEYRKSLKRKIRGLPEVSEVTTSAKKIKEDEEVKNEPEKESKKKKSKKKAAVQEQKMAEADLESPKTDLEPPKTKSKKSKKKILENGVENDSSIKVGSPKKKSKKTKKASVETVEEAMTESPKKKSKKQKSADLVDFARNTDSSPGKKVKKLPVEATEISEAKSKKKKKKSKEILKDSSESEPLIPVEQKKKKKQKTERLFDDDESWNPKEDAQISATPQMSSKPVFLKRAKSAEINKISLLEKEKRRISFALSQNKFQDFEGIDKSMTDSPDIPYVPNKKPKQGVLKTKSANNTPNLPLSKAALSYNTMMNGKSKAAKKLGLNSSRLMFQF